MAKKYDRAQLLEKLFDPSKAISPQFVAYLVANEAGKSYVGVLVSKTDREVMLRDVTDKEGHIPAGDVEPMIKQTRSLMPDGQLRDLTAQQAADLLKLPGFAKIGAGQGQIKILWADGGNSDMTDASSNPPIAFIDAEKPSPLAAEADRRRWAASTPIHVADAYGDYGRRGDLLCVMCALAFLSALVTIITPIPLYLITVGDAWRRTKWLALDLLAGVALPMSCLWFDPQVFRSFNATEGVSFPEMTFAYSLLGMEMLSLVLWLLIGASLGGLMRATWSPEFWFSVAPFALRWEPI